jgi:spermidine/putrescine transport system ATP-binding protein
MQLELKRIQRDDGITFNFVTHDQEEALTMSDRIAIMNQGRIEQLGTPQEIYDEPSSVFVAGFIGSANLLPATVTGTSDGVVHARLRAGAEVAVSADHARFAHGRTVTAMVRPERLQLTATEPPTTEKLDAVVTEAIFQGSSSKIIAKTTDGTEMIADLEADDGRVRPGDRVWITWSPGSVYLLAEETAIIGATTTDVDEVEASL